MRSGQQKNREQARSCLQEEGLFPVFLRGCGECRICELAASAFSHKLNVKSRELAASAFSHKSNVKSRELAPPRSPTN